MYNTSNVDQRRFKIKTITKVNFEHLKRWYFWVLILYSPGLLYYFAQMFLKKKPCSDERDCLRRSDDEDEDD